MSFCHLNVKTKASMLYGAVDIDSAIEKAKELNQKALAVNDYNNTFNAVKFYLSATKAGIKPILGVTCFFIEDCKEAREQKIRSFSHITLLAKNNTGWKNINRIVSLSHDEDHYFFVPRVDFKLLEKYKEGVIILSGGPANGIIGSNLSDKKDSNGAIIQHSAIFKAEAITRKLISIYGKDSVFIELEKTGQLEEDIVIDKSRKLAQKYGLRCVATNNVHYVDISEAESHKTLLSMDSNSYIKHSSTDFSQENFFLKSEQQMLECGFTKDEINCSVEIADQCNVSIDTKAKRLPKYRYVPAGKTSDSYLLELCNQELKKLGLSSNREYVNRLEKEYNDIVEMGFSDYFLIVYDVVAWIKKQQILLGHGRGSAGGSLVSYLLGITKIDPIKYKLIWERFLNKGRGGLPDIDTDVPRSRRQEVLEYIKSRFGSNRVAQLVTLNGLQARAILKEVFRVYNLPFEEANKITSFVPMKSEDYTGITLSEAIETVPELREYEKKYKPWFAIAKYLEGCYKSTGLHAAAVVISDVPFEDSDYPLTRSKDGNLVFGWEMETVDMLNLLKLDILGLNTLDDIQETINLVKQDKNIQINREAINLDDEKTYSLLSQGLTTGVFQLEKQLGKTWSKNLEPKDIEQLSDCISLIRPGPMHSGMHEQYRMVKQGLSSPEYLHDLLIPILEKTYSGCLYQEQVIEICQKLAGMSLIDADKVRKAMGKKKPEEMAVWRATFINGCINKKISKKTAEDIWAFVETFAGYGFNKSHGIGYGLLAYETAYLKSNYTIQFICAKLKNADGDLEKISNLIYDAKIFGISVLPPRIVNKNKDFIIVDEKTIRFGLSAVKGVGAAAINDIIKLFDQCKSFDDILWKLYTTKHKINFGVMQSLIKVGAFDDFDNYRVRMLSRLNLINELTTNELSTIKFLVEAEKINDWVRIVKGLHDEEKIDAIKKKYAEIKMPNKSRRDSIRKLISEFDNKDIFDTKLQNIVWEKELIGLPLSGSESDGFIARNKCMELLNNELDSFEIAVCVDNIKKIITTRGEPMAFLTVRDNSYILDNIVMFPRQYKQYNRSINIGSIIKIRGNLSDQGSPVVQNIEVLT
jgi:DNA polymerase-3 subunit alpha